MAKIRVKLNSTGQTGTVDENEFDPQVYTSLEPEKPKSRSLLANVLPILGMVGGGIAGAVGGPAGILAGGAIGGGIGEGISQNISKEKLDIGKIGVSAAMGAVPFGRGAGILSKVLLPGAGVGALSGLNQENATPQSVVTSAATGAAGAGVLSKVLPGVGRLLGKVSPGLEKGATALESSTRKIRVKPSLSGAGQEKAIDATLTKYGVKGSPQQQYEALQPTMQKVEGEIQKVIKANPGISVSRMDIKKAFTENLKSAVRSGELTEKQATKEIDKYLNDLIRASGGTGKFTNISLERLRNLKKLVNEDYGPVHAIVSNPLSTRALTPKQKVIESAWTSLDDAVKNASPQVKSLLRDESNLFKSIPSLAAARSNPPTLRVMGTSIPRVATDKGKSVLTDVLRKGGSLTDKLSLAGSKVGGLSETALGQTLLGQVGARTTATGLVPQGQNEPTAQYNQDNQPEQDVLPPTDSITQFDRSRMVDIGGGQMLTKKSIDEAIAQDLLQGGGKNFDKLKKISEYFFPEEDNKSGGQAEVGLNVVSELEGLYNQVQGQGLTAASPGLGRILGSLKGETSALLQTSPEASQYNDQRKAFISLVVRGLGERGVLTDRDVDRVSKAIPTFSDTPETAMKKWQLVKTILKNASETEKGTTPSVDVNSALNSVLGI